MAIDDAENVMPIDGQITGVAWLNFWMVNLNLPKLD